MDTKSTGRNWIVKGLVLVAGIGLGLFAGVLIGGRSASPAPTTQPAAPASVPAGPAPSQPPGAGAEVAKSNVSGSVEDPSTPLAESAEPSPAARKPSAAGTGAAQPDPKAVLAELESARIPRPGGRVATLPQPAAAGRVALAKLTGVPLPQSLAKLTGAPWAILPDKQTVVAVAGYRIVLFDSADAHLLRTLSGHSNSVNGVAVAPDGKRLASASSDNTVRLWDLGTGKEIRNLANANANFSGVAYSPDGTSVAAVNRDKSLWLLNVEGGEPKKVSAEISSYQHRVAFSADGATIATIGGGSLILWDAKTLERRVQVDTPESRLLFSPADGLLVTYGDSRTVRLRSAKDARVIRELNEHTQTVTDAACSPSGKYLTSAASQNTEAIVYELATGQVALRLPHKTNVIWVAFSHDGRQVYTYSDVLRAWDLTVVEDAEKRCAFLAWFDGERDHYLRFTRMFLGEPGSARQVVAYPESWGGRVLVRVTNAQGLSLDAVNVQLGNNSIHPSIAVKVGAAAVSVDTKKLRSLEVLGVKGKIARLQLVLLDGSTVSATREVVPVTGHCALGEFSYDLVDVSKLLFNSQRVDEASDESPAPGEMPFAAEVVDSQGTRLEAADIRTGSSNQAHELTFYVDNGKFKAPLRLVRSIDVLATPRGGVIARLSFLGTIQVVGFIGESELARLSGAIGLAQFSLGLEELRAIHFR